MKFIHKTPSVVVITMDVALGKQRNPLIPLQP